MIKKINKIKSFLHYVFAVLDITVEFHSLMHTSRPHIPIRVLKPAIWHKMDVVDRQSPGDTTTVAYETAVTERTIYIFLCTFSLTATQFPVPSGELLTANLGLKCNLWGSQRAQPPQSISTQKPWTLFGLSFIPWTWCFLARESMEYFKTDWLISRPKDCSGCPQLNYVSFLLTHKTTHTAATYGTSIQTSAQITVLVGFTICLPWFCLLYFHISIGSNIWPVVKSKEREVITVCIRALYHDPQRNRNCCVSDCVLRKYGSPELFLCLFFSTNRKTDLSAATVIYVSTSDHHARQSHT